MIVVDEQKENDEQIGEDIATGRLLRSIADSLAPMLKLDEDVCANHRDGKIPILDLKVWPAASENPADPPVIKHTFYKKPMANKATLKASTAYPKSQLRAIMIEEILRRLRNCSPDSSWQEKGVHLTEFANSMKCSGHSETFRCIVFNKALARYKKELDNHNQGIKDLYRSRSDREEERKSKGGKSTKDNWFKKKKGTVNSNEGQTTSVLMVPYTSGVLTER